MTTSFPTSLDNFSNPAASDNLNTAVGGRTHSGQHDDLNDAIEAVEAKVGINSSAVTTSLDNIVTTHQGNVNAHHTQGHTYADHTDQNRSRMFYADECSADTGAIALKGSGINGIHVITLADAATNGARLVWLVPEDFVSGLAVQPIWAPDVTDSSSHSVQWQLNYLYLPEGANEQGAATSEAWTGDAGARTNDLVHFETPHAVGVQPTSPPVIMRVILRRLGSDGADTFNQQANLIGIKFNYVSYQ
jgi:hypothetical protein